jgi:chemotaxis protein MotB
VAKKPENKKPEKERGRAEDKHELIIVRRLEEEEHETHNSAWKVAHADFMTAMMAFFLIMWLINATDEETRKGISAYFNPMHLSAATKGLNGGDPAPSGDTKKGAQDTSPDKRSGSTKASKADPASQPAAQAASLKGGEGPAGGGKSHTLFSVGKNGQDLVGFDQPGGGLSKLVGAPGSSPADQREQAAFLDPYGTLTQLAATYMASRRITAPATASDGPANGLGPRSMASDPFDPAYWQTAPAKPDKAAQGPAATAAPPASVAASPAPPTSAAPEAPPAAAVAIAPPVETPKPLRDAKPSPDAAAAQAKVADKPDAAPSAAAGAEARELRAEVQKVVGPDLKGSPAPLVKVEATGEGILISLTDGNDFSMFDIGSAIPNGKVVFILSQIADMLAKRPGTIVVRGFTDARPFHSSLYDNWRLSAERAHMAYYMLVRGGIDDNRIRRIEGYADHSLKNDGDPNAPENRRIEILLERSQS